MPVNPTTGNPYVPAYRLGYPDNVYKPRSLTDKSLAETQLLGTALHNWVETHIVQALMKDPAALERLGIAALYTEQGVGRVKAADYQTMPTSIDDPLPITASREMMPESGK